MKRSAASMKQELSTCEEIIMNILWDAGKKPMTCPDIIQQLRNRYELDYNVTTVYTFLGVLVKKGFVYMIRDKVNQYYACRDREEYLYEKFDLIARIWFEGDLDKIQKYLKKAD